jgi:ATP-binding cassette, subfamily B, bacterial MsbA
MKQSLAKKGLRELLVFAKVQRASLAIAILMSLVAVLATLALPIGIRLLIDSATHSAAHFSLTVLAAVLLALFVVRGVAGFFASFLLRTTGERVVKDLRIRVFEHLNRLGVGPLSDQSTGDLISRLTNDVASVRAATTDALGAVLGQSTSLVGAAVIMTAMNWHLAIFILVLMPVAGAVSRIFGSRLQTLSGKVQDQLARAAAIAEEVLSAFAVVKAFNREEYETQRYAEASEAVFVNSRQVAMAGSLLITVVEFLFAGATVTIFWYGGTEMQRSALTAGALVAFLFYCQNVAQSVSSLIQIYGKFKSGTGAAARLLDILTSLPETSPPHPKLVRKPLSGSLVFREVGFRIGKHEILRDLSLTIGDGENIAITGPNGGGKSTLIKLVLRFHEPTDGEILLGGSKIRDVDVRDLRTRIGYVPQEVQLFNASVMENIRYGKPHAADNEVFSAAMAANVQEFVIRLPDGYNTPVGERGTKLSGGERQRISLARALLKQPMILLLDEPTSAIDATSEQMIHDALRDVMRNRTVILVTHRPLSLERFSRIVTISEGSIARIERPAKILDPESACRRSGAFTRELRLLSLADKSNA